MPLIRIRKVPIGNQGVRERLYAMIDKVFTPDEWTGGATPRPCTGDWWFVEVDGVLAGFAGLKPSVRLSDTGYLSLAGVLPAYRGLGLQRRLIRKRVAQCKKLGWHTAITETLHDNAPSMRSLIACGFRPYLPNYRWGSSEHVVYWRRVVESSPA